MCELYSNIYKKNSNDIGVDPKLHFIPPHPMEALPLILRREKSLILPLKRLNKCKQPRFHLV